MCKAKAPILDFFCSHSFKVLYSLILCQVSFEEVFFFVVVVVCFFFFNSCCYIMFQYNEISSPYLQWLYPVRKTILLGILTLFGSSKKHKFSDQDICDFPLSCFLLYGCLQRSLTFCFKVAREGTVSPRSVVFQAHSAQRHTWSKYWAKTLPCTGESLYGSAP